MSGSEFLPVEKIRVRKEVEDVRVICSINVATGGGVFHPKFSLMHIKSEDSYYTAQHEKGVVPSVAMLKLGVVQDFHNFKSMAIKHEIAKVIHKAITLHEQHQGYHLCPFTFLVSYCLAHEVDLFSLGILEL
ncbi:MAG: hypothetical protein GY928_13225 [Colwellia sp.]|nr:hypothetical protein [Colwellia sp.]